MSECVCCGNPGKFSIMLVGAHETDEQARIYLPNQNVRDSEDFNVSEETWFCHHCMRVIEDNLRATIMYLRSEAPTYKDTWATE